MWKWPPSLREQRSPNPKTQIPGVSEFRGNVSVALQTQRLAPFASLGQGADKALDG